MLREQFKESYAWNNNEPSKTAANSYELNQIVEDSYNYYVSLEKRNGSLEEIIDKLRVNIEKNKLK